MSRHVPPHVPARIAPVAERAAPVAECAAPVAERAALIAEGISSFWPGKSIEERLQ
jgi:hypothetical protein